MAWDRKISRNVRVRNDQTIGQLARPLAAVSDAGGTSGRIERMTVIFAKVTVSLFFSDVRFWLSIP